MAALNKRYIACLLAVFIAVMSCYVKPVKANVAVVGALTMEGLEALFNILGIAGIEFNNEPFSYDIDLPVLDDEVLSNLTDEQIDRLNELGLTASESATGSYSLTFSDVVDTVTAFTDSVAVSSITPTWLASSSSGSYSIYAANVGQYKHTYTYNVTFDPDVAFATFGFLGGAYGGGYFSFGIGVVLNPDYADTANFAYYYDIDNNGYPISATDLFSNVHSYNNYFKYYTYNDYNFALFYIGSGSYWTADDVSIPTASDFDYAYLDGECADGSAVLQTIYDYIDGIDSTGYDLLGGLGIKAGSIIDSIVDGATSVSDTVADWLAGVTDLTADEVKEAGFIYTPNLQVVDNGDDTYSVVNLGTGVISLDTDTDVTDTDVDDVTTLDPDITADTTSEIGILGSIWTWITSFFTNLYNTLLKALQWFYDLWLSGMRIILQELEDILSGLFIPSEGYIDAQIDTITAMFDVTFGSVMDFDIMDFIGGEQEPENENATYAIFGINFNSDFVNYEWLLYGIAYFRPYIRGFIALMLIIYSINNLLVLIGQAPLSFGALRDLSNSQNSKDGE